jgi:hypothetical protein
MFLVSNVIDTAQGSWSPQFTLRMARKSRGELALFATFPLFSLLFTGNYQRAERSFPQESASLAGTIVEITAR